MSDFSLIKQMNEGKDEQKETSPFPKGVRYQQYELEVDGAERVINIPLRESENFEAAVGALTSDITGPVLKKLLRDFRGIRG